MTAMQYMFLAPVILLLLMFGITRLMAWIIKGKFKNSKVRSFIVIAGVLCLMAAIEFWFWVIREDFND